MDLVKHAYIDGEEFVEYLLSSGDWFPGTYKFTMGERNTEKDQLSIAGLIAAYFSGKRYSRSEWMRHTLRRHTTVESNPHKLTDEAVYDVVDESYVNWMTKARTYDIAVFEIDSGHEDIEKNVTYFFMGSMIRFTDTSVLIGYDLLRSDWLREISIDFREVQRLVDVMYSDSVKDFFLPCDIVASLTFDEEDVGDLWITDETLTRVSIAHDNSVIYASNRDVSRYLPIRWAKDIILTEVSRDS